MDTGQSNPLREKIMRKKNNRSPLTEMQLEVAGVEAFVQVWPGLAGRPPCDRRRWRWALSPSRLGVRAGGRSGRYVNLICVIALVARLFNTEHVIFPSKE
jgi:hypothetical protein